MDSDETLRGARNRAHAARALLPEAAFIVAYESGVAPADGGGLTTFAWVVVLRPAPPSVTPCCRSLFRGR